MAKTSGGAKLAIGVFACLAVAAFAAQKQQFRYTLGPGASISIVNEYGPVILKPSSGNQVVVTATPGSNKVEIDCTQTGNRVEVRTHFLKHADQNDGRVEYEIQVPADANVTVRTDNGPINVQNLRGDINLESDTAAIDVRDMASGMVHARTVSGPITLTNVSKTHVEVASVSGNVVLANVTGPKVTADTTKSSIRYDGNFAGGGDYTFTNHSGDIEVSLPAEASVDMTARSINGSVQNEFPFRPKAHTAFAVTQGHSFAGTSNSGAAMVRIRSFSGTIRVKKQ